MSEVAKTLRFIFAQSLEWADDNGWTDDACQKDRIVDWFGPSDFKAIKDLVKRLEAPALPLVLQGQDFAVPPFPELETPMQSELSKAARDFMFLFIVDGGDRGISLDGIDTMEFSQKFAALEAALSKSGMQEICSVSFADLDAATVFLRDFTKSEGGLPTVDWYALRDRIADKISMTRVEERDMCRSALSAQVQDVAGSYTDMKELQDWVYQQRVSLHRNDPEYFAKHGVWKAVGAQIRSMLAAAPAAKQEGK